MKKHLLTPFLLIAVLVTSLTQAQAQDQLERVASQLPTPEAVQTAMEGKSKVINLIDWLEAQVMVTAERRKEYPPRESLTKFTRELFGSWVNADMPQDCFDTRTEALVRDLEPGAKVQFFPNNKCRIQKGQWWDPYTNQIFTESNQVDIDHIVALQHAYFYGAFRWTPAERCHYANYLGNNYHLLTVSAKENRSKGADDPRMYMPPNKTFTCTYMKLWMKIKLLWDLDVDLEEGKWIIENLKANKCDARALVMGKREFMQQNILRHDVTPACTRRMN